LPVWWGLGDHSERNDPNVRERGQGRWLDGGRTVRVERLDLSVVECPRVDLVALFVGEADAKRQHLHTVEGLRDVPVTTLRRSRDSYHRAFGRDHTSGADLGGDRADAVLQHVVWLGQREVGDTQVAGLHHDWRGPVGGVDDGDVVVPLGEPPGGGYLEDASRGDRGNGILAAVQTLLRGAGLAEDEEEAEEEVVKLVTHGTPMCSRGREGGMRENLPDNSGGIALIPRTKPDCKELDKIA